MAFITATYVNSTQFTIVGDQTLSFTVGRRVRADLNGSYVYGTIKTSAYSSVTTVTLFESVLTSDLDGVWFGVSDRSSVPVLPDRKNKIINGNFNIWQRGTSFTVNGHGADRWYTSSTGSTFITTRQSFTLGQTDVPNNPEYYWRTAVTSSAGASNRALSNQKINKVSTLSNKSFTLSFWAKADATKNIATEMYQHFGTGGSPSTGVSFGVTTHALTTSWQKFTTTIAVPSVSGKTLGTDDNSFIQLGFWFDAGSTYNSRTNTLGQQSGTFDISQIQIEEGIVATQFDHRHVDQEKFLTGVPLENTLGYLPRDEGIQYSYRNKIINGNFDVWQRGTSFTASAYTTDRWAQSFITTTMTTSRQSFTLGQTDVPNEPEYYLRSVVTSGSTAGSVGVITQSIEDVRSLAGKTVILSFWAKADATKNIATEYIQYFGTGGSPSATIDGLGVTTHALTTSWQKFTTTFVIPSILSKTIGTNIDDFLSLVFYFDAGSDFNSRSNSLGNQSGTFDIAQVQLEEGTVATQFEQKPIATELALCQRYFFRVNPTANYTVLGMGRWGAADAARIIINFPTSMRCGPTFSYDGAVGDYMLQLAGGLGAGTVTSLAISESSETACIIIVGYSTGGQTVGYGTTMYTNNQTTYSLTFDSEL